MLTSALLLPLAMPGKKPRTTRTRHDTRKWILKALESGKPEGMLTSEIKASIASLSGSKIPDFSIYSALRTLKKRKQVSTSRHGREFVFKLVSARKAGPPKAGVAPPAALVPAVVPPVPATPSMEPPAAPPALTGQPLHKLAPGEAVILHIGEEHVETATNVYGKIVLERHPRPTKASQ